MVINGKDRGFRLTAGAMAELADLCPNGDIERLGDMLNSGGTGKQIRNAANFLCILNKWYELSNGGNEWLKKEECLLLDTEVLFDALKEALVAYQDGKKTSVDVEPTKKNDAEVTASLI